MIKRTAIIVAGGKGIRMKTLVPKQFLLLKGKPVLMHTIQCFYDYDPEMKIILVLPADQMQRWSDLCDCYSFNLKHDIVSGGANRFESVKRGLSKAPESGYIAVHDGVRPFINPDFIGSCFQACEKFDAVIPVVKLKESVRKIEGDGSRAVNRDDFCLVQTPQVFTAELLHRAYRHEYSKSFTDDASVVEASGHFIHLIEGLEENIKITTPGDLKNQ